MRFVETDVGDFHIALIIILGKLLDKIISEKFSNIFISSMYQYGFKKSHS